MPITSERVSLIVEEALSIARAAQALREMCEMLISQVSRGEGRAEDAISILQTHLAVNPLPQPVHLLLEQRHQQVSARKNKRKRDKAAAKRREKGVPERAGLAPTTLADLGLDGADALREEFNKWNRGEGT